MLKIFRGICLSVLVVLAAAGLSACQAKYVAADPAKDGKVCSFETVAPWDTSPERGFSLKVSDKYVTEGLHSLEVEFPADGQPSINTRRLPSNWGKYDAFAVDVFNPQNEELQLTIRLDDAAKKRVNIKGGLKQGLNQIRIPYTEIAKAIDAQNVRFVVMFLDEPSKRYRLFFDNMRLEGREAFAEINAAIVEQKYAESPAVSSGKGLGPFPKAVIYPDPAVEAKGEIKLPVMRLQRDAESKPVLVSGGIPFAKGQLTSADMVAFFKDTGEEIPAAVKLLASWPDGSVRSLLVQFPFLIPQKYEYVLMKWGQKPASARGAVVEPNWQLPGGMFVLPAPWLCASGVAEAQVPFGQKMFAGYDENLEKNAEKIAGIPWTGKLTDDLYYDLPHVFYQFFVRTGDPRFFLFARRELLYYRDSHIIRDGSKRGQTSDGTQTRYLFVQAMADDYLLTGDKRSLEAAQDMVDYIEKAYPPEKAFYARGRNNFWTEREAAFPLINYMAFYKMTGNAKYLDLARRIVENLHKTQMEWPARGGFIHNLYAHAPDEGARPNEYGGSPFMTGLVLEGLVEYHRVTNDETAADSIFRALEWLLKEGIDKDGTAVKYSSADKYSAEGGAPDLNMLVAQGFAYGYRISGYTEERYRDTGVKLFEKGISSAYLGKRKHFAQNYRSSGHFLYYMQKVGTH